MSTWSAGAAAATPSRKELPIPPAQSGLLDDPVPAEVGARADRRCVRAEHRHDFPAAAREQHVGQHFHEGAAAEPEQRLGPEAQSRPGAGGEQHRRR